MKAHAGMLSALLALGGCATTPADHSTARQVPADRLVGFQSTIDGPSGTLVLTRDKGYLGSGCYAGFFVNEELAARIDNSETATFTVPAGELVLRVGGDPMGRGLCALNKEHWTQRETTFREGEQKFFRLSIDMNGKLDIQRAGTVTP
ncbi:hypothetical protein ACSLC0_00135 [Stenotrophomonas muris]|uniref:hypothetical protein n=1 Tax=Stenotrophomonas muris TaxID=2963283 RepID=UPI0021C7A916|nr:hypothetical protein [Stenotrophomonas maltophilia]